MNYTPTITGTTVRTGAIDVEGLSVFYREAGKPGNPKLVLLGGFPAAGLRSGRGARQRERFLYSSGARTCA